MAETTTTYQLHLKGYVGGWDFDADYVDYVIARHEGSEVHVLIDSLGGSLQTALSVAAAFRRHGNVHVHYSGMNASAATIAGMGAKRITIDSDAFWLVHKASFFVDHWQQANSDDMTTLMVELEKKKNDLETFDRTIAAGYAARCNRNAGELASLMKEERWLTAQEAKDWGFVDEVIAPAVAAKDPAKSVVMAMQEAGLPIPERYRPSLIDRITAAVSAAIGSKKEKNQPEETAPVQNEIEMENKETKVQEPTQSAQPSAEDHKTPVADVRIAELEEQLKAANARIAELEGQPGDDTSKVVDSKPVNQPGIDRNVVDTYASDMSEAVKLFATLP